jgi:hypothetical protein
MAGVALNRGKAKAAADRLVPDVLDAASSASRAIKDVQSEEKWGTEDAPAAFRTAYSDALVTANNDVSKLYNDLSDFRASVNQVVDNFVDTDTDTATAQALLEANAASVAEREAIDLAIKQVQATLAPLNVFATGQDSAGQWKPHR